MAWAISRRLTFWSLILGCGPGQVNEDRLRRQAACHRRDSGKPVVRLGGRGRFFVVGLPINPGVSEGVSRSARIANYVALNGRKLVVSSV
jgi:hypothetical protein